MSTAIIYDNIDLTQETPPDEVAAFLDEPYILSAETLDYYRINGFAKIEGLLTGEALNYFRAIIGAAVGYSYRDDHRTLAEKPAYQQSFLQAMRLCFQFPAIKPFSFSKRFAGVARDLMRVDHVRLWHDQALYKQPHARLTNHHQDAAFWPLEPGGLTTTLWMALCDVPMERGCMAFVPNSHQLGEKEFVDIFNGTDEMERRSKKVRESEWVPLPLRAGDATFHSGLTYHRAFANQTDEMREAMTVIYFGDGARYEFSNPRLERHNREEVGGLRIGAKIDTPTTPILI
ncbi:MAG: phytanoyl-CoA dioxygenase family protein [Chloroflexota bacterium]